MPEEVKEEVKNDESPVPSAEKDESVESSPQQEAEAKESNGFQKRINEIVRERNEERLKNTELELRINDLESKPAEKEDTKLLPPKEDSYEKYEDFEAAKVEYIASKASDIAYERITSENLVRDEEAKRATRNQDIKAKRAVFDKHLESKRSKFKNFEEIAYKNPFMDVDLAEQLLDIGENGPEVSYHLGSNLDEAERIFKLLPLQRARELTKLELTLEPLKPKKVSGAPDPITPLGSSEKVEVDPDKLSTEDWLKRRNKQIYG